MSRCQLIQGPGDNLIWDVVLTCDNPHCEYHRPRARSLTERQAAFAELRALDDEICQSLGFRNCCDAHECDADDRSE